MSASYVSGISGVWIFAIFAFVVGRAAEWRVHRRNYETMRSMGAEELHPWLMRGYYALTMLVVPVAFWEQHLTQDLPIRAEIVIGSALCGMAIVLRFWAIRSLGLQWTMRLMALPGMRARADGPYRVLDNPEYLSRVIEGAGVCLLLNASIALAVYVTATAAYGVYLAGLEQAQLRSLRERTKSVSAAQP